MLIGMTVFHAAQDFAPDPIAPTTGLLKATAVFAQAAQGNLDLFDALRQTSQFTDAEFVSISRIKLKYGLVSAKVLSCDGADQRKKNLRKVDASFAPAILGDDLLRAKAGTVWFGNLHSMADHEALNELYKSAQLSETACIVLEKRNDSVDCLELHFGHTIAASMASFLEPLGQVLSDCWSNRAIGRFAEAKLTGAKVKSTKRPLKIILSVENPCRLSRAEYRMCSLLARGLNNKALVSELGITMPTLRTHLRNIYAKTETTCQSELIHALLAPAPKALSTSLEQYRVA
jgi:DNA-binding CsgD family transcriptional regulator